MRLVPVAEGLATPRHLAFTPDGDLLITELGREPSAIPPQRRPGISPGRKAAACAWCAGARSCPSRSQVGLAGLDAASLQAVVVHPQFATNRFVYLYYVKNRADAMTLALARARFDGTALVEVQEIFEADALGAGRADRGPRRIRAGRHDLPDAERSRPAQRHRRRERADAAQQLDSDVGKVLRIRDDGSIPADNPFVGGNDANAQVFTYGHRNTTDFAWHPTTGELWATEIGPMGGDEINILRSGSNYGWPLVSLGKLYNKNEISEQHWYREGMDMPVCTGRRRSVRRRSRGTRATSSRRGKGISSSVR